MRQNLVIRRQQERMVEIVLANPDRGNAFSYGILEGADAALDDLDMAECDTIVFRGEGKGFCGGLDLTNLEEETDASILDRLIRIELLLQRVARLPQKTIALVHGFAYGAGADLSVACKLCIAAPKTRFAFPGVRFGITLGTGRLAQKIGRVATQDLLSAVAPITTKEAIEVGLVDDVKDMADWDEWLSDLKGRSRALHPSTAALINDRLDVGNHDADLAALVRSAAVPGLRNRVSEYAERVKAAAKAP